MRSRAIRVRVKICGITSPGDAILAARLGADALGLNFYEKSPRSIRPEQASTILRALPVFIEPIALFVQVPVAIAQQAAMEMGFKILQHHADHRELPKPGVSVIPAFPIPDVNSLRVVETYVQRLNSAGARVPAVLLDAHEPGLYGGTGKVAPWELLRDFAPGVPIILAGGLTPENVAQAIRTVRPHAVDVASGVEKAPGVKDAEKMERFIDAVRSV